MTISIADRLFETTITTGTGPFTLSGAVAGFQGFAVLGTGKKTTYYIDDADALTGVVQKWMDVIGTVTVSAGVTTLSVDQVLASSAGGTTAVSFGSGTKNVRGGLGAKVLPITDENLNDVRSYGIEAGTANAHAVTLPYAPLAYSDGMQIVYRVNLTNTTAGVTVNVNSLGAKALKINGSDPGAGVLAAGTLVVGFYKPSSNAFEIISVNISPRTDFGSSRVISGLQTGNNSSDTVNDIDFAVGYGADGSGNIRQLASALTKQLDTTFVQGNNVGGLFSGTKAANTTYHLWLIRRTSDGAIDAGFDISATGANVPSGWVKVARIWSVITNASSAIIGYTQNGNECILKSPVLDVNDASPVATAVTKALTVPGGVVVKALLNAAIAASGAGGIAGYYLSALASDDLAPSVSVSPLASNAGQDGANSSVIGGQHEVWTNTSSQIRTRALASNTNFRVATIGWRDERGKED